MRPAAGLLLASLVVTAGVLAWAASEKVRIDCRARIIEADSLAAHATVSRDPAERRAAADLYARAIRSWVPMAPEPRLAAARLLRTAADLSRDDPVEARLALEAGIAAIDELALVYVPLAAEREELAALRDGLAAASAARAHEKERG